MISSPIVTYSLFICSKPLILQTGLFDEATLFDMKNGDFFTKKRHFVKKTCLSKEHFGADE